MSSSPRRVRALRSTIRQPAAASRAATRSSAAASDPLSGAVIAGDRRGRQGGRRAVARISAPESDCPDRGSALVAARHARGRGPTSVAGMLATVADIHARRHRGPAGPGRGRRPSRPAGVLASSACPTPRSARRASGCARRWPTAASSSRCGGSSPTSPRRACARPGPGLDLPIAAALLAASGQLELGRGCARLAMVGELALDGSVRPVARRPGDRRGGAGGRARRRSSCPPSNGPEAALADGIEVIPLDSLGAAAGAGRRASGRRRGPQPLPLPLERRPAGGPDLADLRGQRHLRYALEVAAAGGHSLLMIGPPGAGKSLAASRLPSILPPLAPEEALEVARIASACGRLDGDAGRRTALPRSPSHGQPGRAWSAAATRRARARRRWPIGACSSSTSSASSAATPSRRCGRRSRRAGSRSPAPASPRRLPCRFMLVAAANPCPCGRGEADPECTCAPLDVQPLPGPPQRRPRRPHRHPRRDPPAERRGDRRRAG